MRSISRLLCALAALAGCACAGAQAVRIVDVPLVVGAPITFHRLIAPGAPLSAQKMAQDRYGFLWFAAANGLQRHDGYGLVRVPERGARNSIGFVIGQSLAIDSAGRLWIGADDALGRYDPATDEFKTYRSPDESCGTVAVAHDIQEDRDGIVWLATDDGITALDPATSKTTCHRPRFTPSIGETRVIATHPARDGKLWITSSEGLYAIDRRSGTVLRHLRLETASGARLVCMGFPSKPFEDSTGRLWFGLSSGGDVASVDVASGDVTVYAFAGEGLAPRASSGVVSIREDGDRALWLATDKLGLVKLAPDRTRATWYQSNPDDPAGLGADLVIGLFRDRDGGFWSITKAGVVYRFDAERPAFGAYRHEHGSARSLGEGAVLSAYADDADTLWIGTNRGLNRVDRTRDRVVRYEDPILARGVGAIAKDRDGNLWLGTRGNGLLRFDARSGRYTAYAHDASDRRSLSHDRIEALRVDSRGNLWIVTDFGLDRWDAATESFERYSPQARSLLQYRSIAEDADGVLWLATASHGLQRFDPRTGAFTSYDAAFRAVPGGGHNRVNSVYVDRAGTIWAATFRGLDRFEPRSGTLTSYDSRHGLPTDAVVGIVEDEGGRLWVSTLDGLSRFDPRSATFTNYHASDGLLTDNFDGPVAVATRSARGEIFFGSQQGLVAFLPEQVVERRSVAPVLLTGLRVSGEPVRAGSAMLKQPIWSATALELEPRSMVSLDFAALSYLDPPRTRYRHRLEGLESRWNETDSAHRSATYATLPAGDYTFRVQARPARGDWTDSVVALRIRVPPPWYATWSFRALVALLVLAALWLSYRMRVRHLRREFAVALDARVNERTRIARDLHDTLLQSFHGLLLRFQTVLELMQARPAEARAMLASTIDQAAAAITEGREAVQGLRDSVAETDSLGASIRALGDELRAQHGAGRDVALHVEVRGVARALHPVVRDETFRIAVEALRNALRHARASQIEVELVYDRRHFRLRVRDDGKGIDARVLDEPSPRGHFGLVGMRERATVIGGHLTVWSAVDAGTEVELEVPALTAYAAAPVGKASSEAAVSTPA